MRDGLGKEGEGGQADATVSTRRAWLNGRLLGMGAGTRKEGGLMSWGMWRQKQA